MLLNASTVLDNANIQLFPYHEAHVERYHTWMSDPTILAQTASEPLSLQEEYAMQASWREDPDKLTFIIVEGHSGQHTIASSLGRMIGDVNLFLHRREDDEADDQNQEHEHEQQVEHGHCTWSGELEIMIAETRARRHGYARAALLLFMVYIVTHAAQVSPDGRLAAFTVKIGADNVPSITLFEHIGFRKVKYSEYFREWEMSMSIDATTHDTLVALMKPEDREWQSHTVVS